MFYSYTAVCYPGLPIATCRAPSVRPYWLPGSMSVLRRDVRERIVPSTPQGEFLGTWYPYRRLLPLYRFDPARK